MIHLTKHQRTAIAILVAFIVMVGVGMAIVASLQQSQSTTEPTPVAPTTPTEPEPTPDPDIHNPSGENTDDLENLFLENIELLDKVYTPNQVLFINLTVQKFADNQTQSTGTRVIDEVSFVQRSAKSYGFTVADAQNNSLFYVIVTKVAGGKVKVDCYL